MYGIGVSTIRFITVNVVGSSIMNTRLNYSSAPLTILKGISTATPTSRDGRHCVRHITNFDYTTA